MIGIVFRYIVSFLEVLSIDRDRQSAANSNSCDRDRLKELANQYQQQNASKEGILSNKDLEQLVATGQAIAQRPSLWLSLLRDK